MNSLSIPNDISPGLVPTLNKFGLMTKIFDCYTKDFIQYAKTLERDSHVAELGAAYGAVTQKLLNISLKVTVNDLDDRHINILLNSLSKNKKDNLSIVVGRIPNEVDFPENTFDAILAARVLQYLMPKDFVLALKKIKKWLKPGGKLFVVSKTPYIKILENFVPLYEKRKRMDLRWPGVIQNLQKYYVDETISHILPRSIHVFDPDILIRACDECGFLIERCSFIDRNDFPSDIKLSGREEVGLVATKK